MPTPLSLVDLAPELRELAARMARVGAAIRYYGGLGEFGEYGALLEDQSAPLCMAMAHVLERRNGAGHA